MTKSNRTHTSICQHAAGRQLATEETSRWCLKFHFNQLRSLFSLVSGHPKYSNDLLSNFLHKHNQLLMLIPLLTQNIKIPLNDVYSEIKTLTIAAEGITLQDIFENFSESISG